MWPKIIAIALPALLNGLAFEQGTPGQSSNTTRYYVPVSGRIVGYNGAPIPNQTLFLTGSGREDVTTKTDQDGRFRFESVEAGKSASLRMIVTGFDASPIDLGILRGGDMGTVVLQPSRPSLIEDMATSGATRGLLSGRITAANGISVAGKILLFTNGKVGGFLKMDENGSFVFPAASYTEYEIYVSDSGLPLAQLSPKLKYVGNILMSDGQDVNLGNVALIESSSKKGQWGDIAGPVAGDIPGPVKITPVPPASLPSTSGPKAASIAAVFAGANGTTIIHDDGTIFRVPKEKEQVGSSSPKISPDKTLAGWLVDSDFCCTSYPLQFMLVVYVPGMSLRHFTGDGRAIFGWNFIDGGKRVAFFQSFPHGDPVPHSELRDITTERLVGKWDGDLTSKTPAWVRGLGQ